MTYGYVIRFESNDVLEILHYPIRFGCSIKGNYAGISQVVKDSKHIYSFLGYILNITQAFSYFQRG